MYTCYSIMKVLRLRRANLGRLLVLGLFMTAVIVYVALLRFNKASVSGFNLKHKRKHKHPQGHGLHDARKFGLGHGTARPRKPGQKEDLWEQVPPKPLPDKRRSRLNVYVVEEHHEVLQYWFRAVDEGFIPRHGNTLIHIDGHSDLAPPFYFPGYPFFKYPNETREIKFMMQRNDAFITAAAMTGMITRVVWIWPRWDKGNHEYDYNLFNVDFGWAAVNDAFNPGQKTKTFCICNYNTTIKERECKYMPVDAQDGKDEQEIDPSKCHVRKSVLYEEVREDMAVTKLERDDWIRDKETVLLDIDEDYFGCTHAIQPLLRANISMQMIKQINSVVMELICPSGTSSDRKSDRLLAHALEVLKIQSPCVQERGQHNPLLLCVEDKTALRAENILLKALVSTSSKVTCSKKSGKNRELIKKLIALFRELKQGQIHALQKVGFCASTGPKTFEINGPAEFKICQGNNVPGDSVVTIHQPDKTEISWRAKKLKSILTLARRPSPKLITLCRSVRDGYTPRKYFKRIEQKIITVLNVTFARPAIHYDRDLLGGKMGWPDRQLV